LEPVGFSFLQALNSEPSHIHVERDDNLAKFWLDPVRLQSSGGFSRHEIARIQVIILEHQQQLQEAWYGYFNN